MTQMASRTLAENSQNKGRLSKGKRSTFSEISDQEIDRIEKAVWGAWQDAHPVQGPEDRS
jgi:hypothetical protein